MALHKARLSEALDYVKHSSPRNAELIGKIRLGGVAPARNLTLTATELVDDIACKVVDGSDTELLAGVIEDDRIPRATIVGRSDLLHPRHKSVDLLQIR